ncbi:MAG: cadmium resistance transporter [Bacteroidota bacterium]|nr:cadmium resistance transporter [Bacteroidota bacterium]
MKILVTSILTFVSTNIDDIFILVLFYGNPRFKEKEIIAGQLIGILALTGASLLASLIGLLIDKPYIGLFGLIPIYLGAKALWTLVKNKENEEAVTIEEKKLARNNLLSVAGTTFANGGDNIGIYVPLFATLTWTSKFVMVLVFIAMTFLWCYAARYLTQHPYVARAVNKYGHLVTPFVLILLGLYILYENQSVQLITKL